jgi:hypothetical protein
VPQDHYIAKTYLKHFAGSDGRLWAYRKRDGSNFPCRPRDICRELDGDLIPDFLSDPTALGLYRALFEPSWNLSITALQSRAVPPDVKMAIAGYAANMMVCTPAMTRLFAESYTHDLLVTVRARHALNLARGKTDETLRACLEAIDKGDIALETERDYIRALMAKNLMAYAWQLYNADWVVVNNDTAVEFLTSDNPFAFEDPGPFRGGQAGLPRFLPITPRMCLYVVMDPKPRADEPDFSKPPDGSVRFATTHERGIDRVNLAVVRCAEEIVLGSAQRDEIDAVVRKNAPFRVSNEFITIREPDGFLNGIRSRVWDPAINNQHWQFPPAA